jgi:MSHA biogenesis protein MshL
MKRAVTLSLIVGLAACATPQRPSTLDDAIARELEAIKDAPVKPRPNRALEQALIPPLAIELPRVNGQALEPRFDLSVRQAPAPQVFMSIVQGTRYSMLLHPDVAGTVTVNLKDVTVKEALDSIREIYGYDYKIEGTRIFVQPIAMQTRVFRVNYLIGQRWGRSDTSVNSGISRTSQAEIPQQNYMTSVYAPIAGQPGISSPTGLSPIPSRPGATTQITTVARNDFWADLTDSLRSIVGIAATPQAPTASGAIGGLPGGGGGAVPQAPTVPGAAAPADGRSVIVNAQSGVVVVRAMPAEIKAVEEYLRALRISIERQVMLEAKIIEVTLGDGYQAGVNWALFNNRAIGGVTGPLTLLGRTGNVSQGSQTFSPSTRQWLSDTATGPGTSPLGNGSLFGLALQTDNFAALVQFLETQGSVQVLSSPRIAAVNNQKAVLKVGTEEFFVTNVQGGTAPATGTTTGATTTLPTLTVQPFFSGVSLDVLPQIDEDGSVTLHVRPTVSVVEQDNRSVNLGSTFGTITLPLARATSSETDSVVRVLDGNIVAIGGLMKIDVADNRSGLPGVQDSAVGGVFGSRRRTTVKREMVVLIKPTVIRDEQALANDARNSLGRIQEMTGRPGFVVMPGQQR